jgi:hypothetical protein
VNKWKTTAKKILSGRKCHKKWKTIENKLPGVL